MPFQVPMPQVGESIFEATVVRWNRRPGERIERDEPLCILSTDKAEMDLPSPVSGVVEEVLVEEGRTVRVGTVIATVQEGEAASPGVPPAAEPVRPEVPTLIPSPAGVAGPRGAGRVFSSPVVRRLARENALDLLTIRGTGRQGRISRRDVLAHMEARAAAPPRGVGPSPAALMAAGPPLPGFPTELLARFAPVVEPGDVVEPMGPVRRAIFDHMALTWHVAPHVHALAEVDFSRIQALRRGRGPAFEAREGFRLTYTPFLARALVSTLQRHPRLNASVTAARESVLHRGIHLGIAVALPDGGLVVPVLRDAQDYTLTGLARRVDELARRARERRLQPDELRGGTFTLSNLGVFGNLAGMPLINQPQVGIVGIGAVKKRVVVLEDQGDAIAVRPMAYVTLGYDHRAVDGSASGAFLRDFRVAVDGFDEEP